MAVLLAALLLGLPAFADQTAISTGTIRGRVIAGDTGEPIGGATVWVVSSGTVERERDLVFNSVRRYRTDDRGAFLIQGVPSGTCVLQAIPPPDKVMYLQTGSVRGTPQVFDVADGQVLDIDLVLPRAGAISGRVLDEYGRPMAGVRVVVLARRPGRRLSRLPIAFTTPVSDDYGRFRAWGLPSGTYYVRAEPDYRPTSTSDDPDAERFVRTYYSGVTSFAEASPLTLRTSEEIANADVRVVSSRVFHLDGLVVDAAGRPAPDADVSLDFADEHTAQSGQRDLADADGRFEFTRLIPADYVLAARTARGDADTPKTTRPTTLTIAGGDVRDVRLTLTAGVTLTGEIVTDVGAPPPLDPAGVQIMALAAENQDRPLAPVGSGAIHGDWRFDLAGILVPVVIRLSGLPKGWFVRELTRGGEDILDRPWDFYADREAAPLRVVVSGRSATLSGLVDDAAGRPAPMRSIWLLRDRAVLPAPWFTGSTTAMSNEHGRFEITAIPPGRYFVIAADNRPAVPPDDERLAEMLKLATRITLGEQERREIRLRLVPWPY